MDEKAYYDKVYRQSYDAKRKSMIETEAKRKAEEEAAEPSKALRFLKKVGKGMTAAGKIAGEGIGMAAKEYQKIADNIDEEAVTGFPSDKKGDEKYRKEKDDQKGQKNK